MTRKARTRIGRTVAAALVFGIAAVTITWRPSAAKPLGTARQLSPAQPIDTAHAKSTAPLPAPRETASGPLEPTFYDPPDPYDLAAIRLDPIRYYSRSVPSRVWQIAPLPPDETYREAVLIVGPRFRFVAANDPKPVPLTVQAKPGRPVTFTALDQGRFANGQISVTIPTDGDGCATIDFWVGDAGGFRVLAGSPENQGPAEFMLRALPPAQLRDLESGEYARKYFASVKKNAASRGDAEARKKQTGK